MTAYPILWANDAVATLAASISNSQVTLTLTSGEGALFPSPSAGQFFSLTLISASNANLYEITYCTARSGDTLTVQRGVEGTTALGWNAGDLAQNLLTAGQLASFPQLAVQNEWQAKQIFDVAPVLSEGLHSIGYDSGGANVRVSNGVRGAFLRIDGSYLYVMLTNNDDPYGSFNSLRPLYVNLSTGAVEIDGTGAGVAMGGAATIATGARGSGNSQRIVNLGDYSNSWSGTNNGWNETPDGFFLQVINQGVPFTASTITMTIVALPRTFPNNILAAICNYDGTTPSPAVAVSCQPYDSSHVSVTTSADATSGSGTAGVVIWAWGF